MAGYSATPLVQKLGFKAGQTFAFYHPPSDWEARLVPLPPRLHRLRPRSRASFDLMVAFFKTQAELQAVFPRLVKRLNPHGSLWFAWPKKASKVATDLSEDVIRDLALAEGLVDNKVCAIDEVWSGLRVVHRLLHRPGR